MRHQIIQSVVFPKSKFSAVEAMKWLSEHNLRSSKMDITENTYRFRQVEPPSGRYYTKVLPNGVELIICVKQNETPGVRKINTKG